MVVLNMRHTILKFYKMDFGAWLLLKYKEEWLFKMKIFDLELEEITYIRTHINIFLCDMFDQVFLDIKHNPICLSFYFQTHSIHCMILMI